MERLRYEILSVIGRGGFGSVYRARRLGAHGFQKEVALKILTEKEPTPEVLARFRDESRLLGRVRHPNLPGVGPPTRLDDYWAVEMDLVEGVDCHRLVKKRGPLPVSVALTITAVIAQTLHELYNWQNDTDDTPLHLLHRDIKPSNIMVTHRGQVALLDFGIAKADFDTRESLTTDNIGGTVGYMPPERVEGIDGPAGDIYSLGVVLHMMLTGDKPQSFSDPSDEQYEIPEVHADSVEEFEDAIALSAAMRALNPADRPSSLAVAERCRGMVAAGTGPVLAGWASDHIPDRISLKPDERVGNTLREPRDYIPPEPSRWTPLYFLAAAIAGLVLLALGLAVGWALRPADRVIRPPVAVQLEAIDGDGEMRPGRLERLPNGKIVSRSQAVGADGIADTEPVEEVEPEPPTGPTAFNGVLPSPSPRPDPRPSPRPDPTPNPTPSPTPSPSPVSSSGMGSVSFAGGETGWLQKGNRRLGLTAEPGTYDLWVEFDGKAVHAATVQVVPGKTLVATCMKRFRKCRVR